MTCWRSYNWLIMTPQLQLSFSDSSVGKESSCSTGDPSLIPGESICWRRDRLLTPVFLASLVTQLVKNLSAMWYTWVRFLGWECPLQKERLPTPVFWPGKFHGLYSPWGRKELDTTEWLSLSPRNCSSGLVTGWCPFHSFYSLLFCWSFFKFSFPVLVYLLFILQRL